MDHSHCFQHSLCIFCNKLDHATKLIGKFFLELAYSNIQQNKNEKSFAIGDTRVNSDTCMKY